jgi:hypothetical protein
MEGKIPNFVMPDNLVIRVEWALLNLPRAQYDIFRRQK